MSQNSGSFFFLLTHAEIRAFNLLQVLISAEVSKKKNCYFGTSKPANKVFFKTGLGYAKNPMGVRYKRNAVLQSTNIVLFPVIASRN